MGPALSSNRTGWSQPRDAKVWSERREVKLQRLGRRTCGAIEVSWNGYTRWSAARVSWFSTLSRMVHTPAPAP